MKRWYENLGQREAAGYRCVMQGSWRKWVTDYPGDVE